jgi:tRNA-specific 2-thiouridylase
MSRPLVILGMSGGVDSSVAAWRLLQQGYDVQGLFMSNWEEDETGYCTAADDYQDARRVSSQLGIVLHKVNFAADYRERVFRHFIDEYRVGRTPNPDVLCNREIKFGVCFDYARRLGAEYVATGHYAQIAAGVAPQLSRAVDRNKDQSYFLHAVAPEVLARTLFPIGDITKDEVRRIAREQTLAVHDKKDSTGICFIGERPFAEFLARYLPAQPGDIEMIGGGYLGRHTGLMYYTLGQRQGLGIGGRHDSLDEPWYVVGKDIERNVLFVAQGHDNPALQSDGLEASQLTWCGSIPEQQTFDCTAKTRYRQPDQSCHVQRLADGRCRIEFEQPQRAVTPGQYVVLYRGEACLGGALIERTWKKSAEITTAPDNASRERAALPL